MNFTGNCLLKELKMIEELIYQSITQTILKKSFRYIFANFDNNKQLKQSSIIHKLTMIEHKSYFYV